MAFLLWLIAVIVFMFAVVSFVRGEILWGIVLLIVACAVGPGGWSIFH